MIKLFKKTSKKTTAARLLATAVVAAALALSCDQPVDNGGTRDGTAGTGRVTVSTGGGSKGGAALSVMPEALEFDGYKVTFTPDTTVVAGERYTIVLPGDGDEDGLLTEAELGALEETLAVGGWTVKVEAYRTLTGETAPGKAAEGTVAIEVSEGDNVAAEVRLEPIPMNPAAGHKGAFNYDITLTAGVTGTLTLKKPDGTPIMPVVDLTSAPTGQKVLDVGSYDMVIALENTAGHKAGLYARVFIYSGLESKLVRAFGAEDFVSALYVRVPVPTGAGIPADLAAALLTAYSKPVVDTPISDTPSAHAQGGYWTLQIPLSLFGETVYFKAKSEITKDVYIAKVPALTESGDIDARLVKQTILATADLDKIIDYGQQYITVPTGSAAVTPRDITISQNAANLFVEEGTVEASAPVDGSRTITIRLTAKEGYVFTIDMTNQAAKNAWAKAVVENVLGATITDGIDLDTATVTGSPERTLVVTAAYGKGDPTIGVTVELVDFPVDAKLKITTEDATISADGKTITANWNKNVTLKAEVVEPVEEDPPVGPILTYRWELDGEPIADANPNPVDDEVTLDVKTYEVKPHRLTVFVTINGGAEYSGEDVTFTVQ